MEMTLKEALEREIKLTGRSLANICSGADVSYEQMKKVMQGKTKKANYEDVMKIARHLGKSVDELINSESNQSPAEIVDLYNQLSDSQRLKLIGYGGGMLQSRGNQNE